MRVEKDIVVSAPVERVYQLWTDFENFPRFMEHVDEVRHVEGDTYHWKAKIGPLTQEWDAEVRGLVPNRTVTWRSISGADNAGAVTLASKGHITEMHVVIEYAPNLFERLAEMVTHELTRSIEEDLERFRALAEGRATGDELSTDRGGMKIAAAGRALPDSDGTTSTPTQPGIEGGMKIAGAGRDVSDTTDTGGTTRPAPMGGMKIAGATGSEPPSTSRALDTDTGDTTMRPAPMGGMKIAGATGDPGDTTDTGGMTRPAPTGGMKIAEATGDPGGTDDDNPVSRVELGGLGSDASPGEDVGATSPEEIAAARRALRGDDDSSETTGGSAGGLNAAAGTYEGFTVGSGSPGLPAGGDFLTDANRDAGGPASESTNMDSQGSSGTGATSGYANQASGDPMAATAGSMGGTPPNDPTGGAGSVTTGTGPMGPSLMTYEAGTNPPADNFSTGPTAGASTAPGGSTAGSMSDGGGSAGGSQSSSGGSLSGAASDIGSATSDDLGGRNLGSLSNDRTNLGGNTVSSGSLTDTGRAGNTGGMAGGTGPTTAGNSSLAGAGGLGGGPSDMGGQAATLDLGSTPHGGGTGRGAGDAYGSTVVTQGGPHSHAMPLPAETMDDSAPTAGTGGMTSSGTGGTAALGDRPLGGAGGASWSSASGSGSGGAHAAGSDEPPAGTVPTARADQGAVPGVDYAGPADRDLEDPAADPTMGGTGANYSGGTGGWGTEDPTNPAVQGWTPPGSDAEGTTGRGETH